MWGNNVLSGFLKRVTGSPIEPKNYLTFDNTHVSSQDFSEKFKSFGHLSSLVEQGIAGQKSWRPPGLRESAQVYNNQVTS